ncbi:MAG: chemotaxis-specific protein-glutamate methyltransferase CheB [Bacteroidetes bacterium]|nr:chemotaxis-specific protein-glutamate methyltransferase CheB [Bacteroidota bacterium]MBU1114405.1 chemotaxis-specific protein-glutamate methyltransferase CheB [Bacteroidota bacterium]MBU1797206.1 chemotaxis-specific protein-glutamate methyltransferase CheB [Bacteroidota bacterium]
MIKVLIAEDSPVMQQLLIHAISSDPIFKIVGIANNGEEAIEAVKRVNPDIIAMDWQMPKLDGKEATRIIMQTNPTPIVIVTGSIAAKDVAFSFSMIEAGALAIVKKPPSVDHPDYKKDTHELIKILKLMSEVKMVRRTLRTTKEFSLAKSSIEEAIWKETAIQAVVIGASTGGPLVLQKILSGLSKNIPVPILIVQHISQDFTEGFVEWLRNTTNFPLHIASNGERLLPGHGYVAPDDFHMGVEAGPKIILSKHELENNLRPSVAFLFRTAAHVFSSRAVGIILTGMGRDGAEELKLMRDKGAITFAQDKESSVVHGMPGEAIKLNAAMHILSPENITKALIALIRKMNGEF